VTPLSGWLKHDLDNRIPAGHAAFLNSLPYTRFGYSSESIAALQSHRCSVFRNPGMGQIVPWRLKMNDDEVQQPVVPAICTNDEILELHAVLAGRVIGQLAGVTAAPYIRAKQLVPLLVEHIPDRYSYFVYYGSRSAQPARARAFIDLAVKRLVDNSEYVLSTKELRAAARSIRKLPS